MLPRSHRLETQRWGCCRLMWLALAEKLCSFLLFLKILDIFFRRVDPISRVTSIFLGGGYNFFLEDVKATGFG